MIAVAATPDDCPFCGGTGYMVKALRAGYELWINDPDAYAYRIRCRSCAAEGPWSKASSDSAIRLWNTRPAHRRAHAARGDGNAAPCYCSDPDAPWHNEETNT
jgi:hypothetical protein